MCVCLCVCVHAYVCMMCVYMYMYECAFIYVVSMHMCVSIHESTCGYLCWYYVCFCTYVCVLVSPPLRAWTMEQETTGFKTSIIIVCPLGNFLTSFSYSQFVFKLETIIIHAS